MKHATIACILLHATASAQPLEGHVNNLLSRPGAIPLLDLYAAGHTVREALQHIKDTFNGLIVVEFSHTGYCAPCRFFSPIFERVAREMPKHAVGSREVPILFIEVDANSTGRDMFREAAFTLAIGAGSVPSVYFFAHGACIGEIVGFRQELRTEFRSLVAHYAAKV